MHQCLSLFLFFSVLLAPAHRTVADELYHSDLSAYHDSSGAIVRDDDGGGWQSRRSEILAELQRVMGTLPPSRSEVALDLQVDESRTVEDPDFRRDWISLASGDGDRIPTLLYIPKGASASDRRPGIVALHPTSPLGKLVVAGEGPLPNRNYAEELARRGYVVIAPDYPSFGDYSGYNFATDSYVSGTMKGIVNHRRCVDYLLTRDDVVPDRIGAIGHSLGGHNAMFLGVFDERVQAVVSSCGWNAFGDYYEGDITGWSGERYMPRLKTDYGLDLHRVPFDFHEIVGALAPRWFLSVSPLRDRNFEVTGVMRVIPEARKVYQWQNVPDRLVVRYPNAEHDFPQESRREAYAFLDRA
ncbi:MAG: alpha/beta fold hydrolase, partial [Verrucomicrobiae bacterium]|nr:alpha/beta fold hydrolase [Verrucomicrobiae bacterium]